MKLPALTEVLINISVLLQRYFLIAIAGLAAIIFLLRKYLGTKPGRKNFEQFLFHLPGVGEFFRVLAVERFT